MADHSVTSPESKEFASDLSSDTSGAPTAKGTIPAAEASPPTAVQPRRSEEAQSLMPAIDSPLPSKPQYIVHGKSIQMWSIERRRAAKNLCSAWNDAVRDIEGPAFAIHVDQLVSEIDRRISGFRGVPYEDAFAGILQLLRDSLSGRNFVKLQKERKHDVIGDVLSSLANRDDLDLSTYRAIHNRIAENGLLGADIA